MMRWLRGLLLWYNNPMKSSAWSPSHIERWYWYKWIGIKPEDVKAYLDGASPPHYDPRDFAYLDGLDRQAKVLGFPSGYRMRQAGFGLVSDRIGCATWQGPLRKTA
jgi:hypothetical protein